MICVCCSTWNPSEYETVTPNTIFREYGIPVTMLTTTHWSSLNLSSATSNIFIQNTVSRIMLFRQQLGQSVALRCIDAEHQLLKGTVSEVEQPRIEPKCNALTITLPFHKLHKQTYVYSTRDITLPVVRLCRPNKCRISSSLAAPGRSILLPRMRIGADAICSSVKRLYIITTSTH